MKQLKYCHYSKTAYKEVGIYTWHVAVTKILDLNLQLWRLVGKVIRGARKTITHTEVKYLGKATQHLNWLITKSNKLTTSRQEYLKTMFIEGVFGDQMPQCITDTY